MPQQLFSGNWSSATLLAPGKPSTESGFWYRVDADLVIHGATQPKSTVVIQGQSVTLRKDGTFSLRVALPEGTQTIQIDVTSPDGRHTRTMAPMISLSGAKIAQVEAMKKRLAQRRRPLPGQTLLEPGGQA